MIWPNFRKKSGDFRKKSGAWHFFLVLAAVTVAWVGGYPSQGAAFSLGEGLPDQDETLADQISEEDVGVGLHDGYPQGHVVGTYYVKVVPSNAKAIIVMHGGDAEGCIVSDDTTPCAKTRSWAGAWFSGEMVRQGYTVISMDYHPDYEHSLYVDIQAVVNHYVDKFSLTKVALFGQSHGGLNVTRELWKDVNAPQAGGMDVSGPVDVVDLWQYVSKESPRVLRWILKRNLTQLFSRPGNCGVPEPKNKDYDGLHTNCQEHWQAFSPADVPDNCNKTDGACNALAQYPLFLAHSDTDDRVPEREAFALCNGLQQVGGHVAVAYYLLHNLKHWFMNFNTEESQQVLAKFLYFLDYPSDTICRAEL